MTGHGEIIHKNHKFCGKFKENFPKGKGKYVFDIGAEQVGEYLTTAQAPEEGAEEDTPPVVTTRWIVERTQQVSSMYEPTADDLRSPELDKPEGMLLFVGLWSFTP